MAADALEEKINKIRQQNEEIKRRHEEVEADKKNAARLNALVQMVPSTDWPERKEPPEFSDPPKKYPPKAKNIAKESNEQNLQYRAGGTEGKKVYNFPQGEGPPPDPKYNFLADSEREEKFQSDRPREETGRNGGKNSKPTRNSFRKKRSGGEWQTKDSRYSPGFSLDSSHPDYDDWRAERNRIDEARINRQRTAEGNWRREWDNDKIHMADETSRKESQMTLGELVRHDNGDGDKHHRGPPRNSYYSSSRESDYDKRVINDTDKNIKVNHGVNAAKNSVTSVKVSSSNIAGTGRVGPRQRTRMMYSSHSERESLSHEISNFNPSNKLDERSNVFNNSGSKSSHSQRRRDSEKSGFSQRKEYDMHDTRVSESLHSGRNISKNSQKSPHVHTRENHFNYPAKSPKNNRRTLGLSSNDSSNETWGKIETFSTSDVESFLEDRSSEVEPVISRNFENLSVISDLGNIQNEKLEMYESNSGNMQMVSDDSEPRNVEQDINNDSGYIETVLDDAVNASLTKHDNESLIIEYEDVEQNEKLDQSPDEVSMITGSTNDIDATEVSKITMMRENILENVYDGEEKSDYSLITDCSEGNVEKTCSITQEVKSQLEIARTTSPVHQESTGENLQVDKFEVEFLNTDDKKENLITEPQLNTLDIGNMEVNITAEGEKREAIIIGDTDKIIEHKEPKTVIPIEAVDMENTVHREESKLLISSMKEEIQENKQVEDKTSENPVTASLEENSETPVAQKLEDKIGATNIVPSPIEKSLDLIDDSCESQIIGDQKKTDDGMTEILSGSVASKNSGD